MSRIGTPILVEHPEFHIATSSQMIGVTPRTLRRWAKSGRISCIFDEVGRVYRFRLDEINRIRRLRGYNELTQEQAATLAL
jgi:predicted site-specific integrase-resolvase